MKKLVLAGAVALFGLSNAQIAKGTVYVSGQVGFSQESDNNTDKKVSEINIVPTVGYFVNTNLAIGLGVGYKNGKTTTEVNNSQTVGNITTTSVGKTKDINNAIVVEPFVRKYWTLSDKLYIFGQLSVPMEFGSGKDKNELTTTISSSTGTPATTTTTTSTSVDKAKSTSIGVAVKPGLDYFLNKNWTIEATIGEFGYNNKKYNTDGAKSVDNYNFGLNLSSVTIGVKYVFAK
ncbi:outer membrane beta-barrel protein [Chryseobacterium sp. L7]|uniref:Outer membrane beta-barrel protein n=1 Tax=Chryseobacterium endalhagicum TaxID=2797638 RepID=A0ABS1QDZ5_9FLAO|nr:outer membrane beta-barrel protein [Chryseobacterium endalhagicum]MBL1220836.1 outer membrane beta-barrel protein [Chryseobacterium endalhagicum]